MNNMGQEYTDYIESRLNKRGERRLKLDRVAGGDIRNAIRCRSSQNKRRKIERKQR